MNRLNDILILNELNIIFHNNHNKNEEYQPNYMNWKSPLTHEKSIKVIIQRSGIESI